MSETRVMERQQYRDFSLRIFDRSMDKAQVIRAQLEITYRCNLHCLHCYTDPYNAPAYFPRELSLQEIQRILDEMAEYGILWLNLTGGEIFCRKDFFDIYEYAWNKGFLIVLYTNGTVFTKKILERLKIQPPFFIDVSCHSVNEEAFDRFTQGPGSFGRFMRGIGLLKESGLPFRIKTKAMHWNKAEMPAIRNFVESLGLKFEWTSRLEPRLDGDLSPLDLRLSSEEIQELEAQEGGSPYEESCRDPQIALKVPPESLYRCGCGTNTIHISAWGELGSCVNQYEVRASLRKYHLREAVEKVFHEIRALKYRSDSPCRLCLLYTFCDKSPSFSRWAAGDPEKPIPHDCDVALGRARRFTRTELKHPLEAYP